MIKLMTLMSSIQRWFFIRSIVTQNFSNSNLISNFPPLGGREIYKRVKILA